MLYSPEEVLAELEQLAEEFENDDMPETALMLRSALALLQEEAKTQW